MMYIKISIKRKSQKRDIEINYYHYHCVKKLSMNDEKAMMFYNMISMTIKYEK